MSNLPQPPRFHAHRPTRVRPAEFTAAILRSEDGNCTSGQLETFSLTGGLLSLPQPLDQGTRAKLLFLTQTGPVLGMAELLKPVSWKEQPFRFLALGENDQRRLWAATGSLAEYGRATPSSKRTEPEHAAVPENAPAMDHEQCWIEKYRSAIDDAEPTGRRFPKLLAATLTAATLALGIIYVLQAQLLR